MRMRNLLATAGLLLGGIAWLSMPGTTRAADHGDAPNIDNDSGADIADVFLFLDPADNTKVCLLGTVHGFIVPGEAVNFGAFDPTVLYHFAIENTGDAKPDAFIDVTFSEGTDIYFARQQALERIGGATLPDGVDPEMEAPFSPSGLVYRYVVQSTDRSPMDLHVFQDWVLDKAFRAVPGVADVASLGGPTMQYQVLVDPNKLAGAGLSIDDVSSALSSNNSNAGGGFISEGGQFFYIRGLGRVATLEDIGNIVIAVKNSVPVLIKDIGSVQIGYAGRF